MQSLLLYVTPFIVLVAQACAEECLSAFKCESLIVDIPTCKNKSEALICFAKSCEANNPAVMLNIQAYETAEEVLCGREDLKEGFEGRFNCWMTAISCSWMHLVAESAEATRQICVVRRKSMRQCFTLGEDKACEDIIGNFTDALNAISACGAAQLTQQIALIVLVTGFLLAIPLLQN